MRQPRRNHLTFCALLRFENLMPNGKPRKGIKCNCATQRAARAGARTAQLKFSREDYTDFGVSLGNGNYIRPNVRIE